MKKELYLMRHGETLFNVRRRIQGWCDSPLTEKGIAQAKKAGELIHDIAFDHYYSSTAERCCDTLELVAGQVVYTRLKGLKERNFGIFEAESEDLNPKFDGDFSYDDLFPNYGGETTHQVAERLVATLTEVMEKADHQCVLAVSHAGACITFLNATGNTHVLKQMHGLPNCAILHFTYEKGVFDCIDVLKP